MRDTKSKGKKGQKKMAPRKGRGGNGKDEIGLDSIEEDRIGLGSKVEPGGGMAMERVEKNGRKGRERGEERIGQGRLVQYRVG